jgi:hypothetical protein
MGKGTHQVLFDDEIWGRVLVRARARNCKRVSDYVEKVMDIATKLEAAEIDPVEAMKNALSKKRGGA